MMDQPSFEREVNAYLLNVDSVLKSKGLLNDKGSAKLNKVQKEVDLTLDKLRAMQRESKLTRPSAGQIANQSLSQVNTISDQVLDGVKVPLGGIFGNASKDSMLSNPTSPTPMGPLFQTWNPQAESKSTKPWLPLSTEHTQPLTKTLLTHQQSVTSTAPYNHYMQ
jgi:hypothetical protein